MVKLIFEGTDSSGKSTAIRFLVSAFYWKKYSSHGPPKSREEYYNRIAKIQGLPTDNTDVLIFDRFPIISEQIYQRVMQREKLLSDQEFKMLESELLVGSVVVYCKPSLRTVVETADPEFQSDHNIKDDRRITAYKTWVYREYEKYFQYLRHRSEFRYGFSYLITFDYTTTTLEELANECRRCAKYLRD